MRKQEKSTTNNVKMSDIIFAHSICMTQLYFKMHDTGTEALYEKTRDPQINILPTNPLPF